MKLSDLSLKKNVKYNDHLHPKIWTKDDKLKPDVRKRLIAIAESFIEYLEVDASTVEDYLVVGSIANYNWNEYSDIDLHILMDFAKASESCNAEVTEEWLMGKRALWMERYDITLDGLKVEVGPQDLGVELNSSAVYSVLESRWIKKPKHSEPDIDKADYDKKMLKMIDKITKVLKSDPSSAEVEALQDEIKDMRQSTLNKKGAGDEFSVNNLIFKALRNQGLMDKLKDLKIDLKVDELSS